MSSNLLLSTTPLLSRSDREENAALIADKGSSTAQRTVIQWTCPQTATSCDVQLAIRFAKKVKETVNGKKSQTTCSLIRTVLGNFFKSLCCCCCKRDKTAVAVQAADILSARAAWSYKRSREAIEKLKKSAPWKDTVYVKADDMFAQAREVLFSNQAITKYLETPLQCTITTPDGVNLDGVYFKGTQKKTILLAMGLSAHYEECAVDYVYNNFVSFFQNSCNGLSVLIVNTRGILLSESASSHETMAIDIYSAYQFLIQNFGLNPEDVLTWGHSLGGSYGLQGAALIQKEYPDAKISAVIDRSFLNASDMATEALPRCAKVLKRVVETFGLEVKGQDAAASLKGKILAIVSEKDEIIPYAASFPVKLKQESKTIFFSTIYLTEKVKVANGLDHLAQHVSTFGTEETTAIQKELKKLLQ